MNFLKNLLKTCNDGTSFLVQLDHPCSCCNTKAILKCNPTTNFIPYFTHISMYSLISFGITFDIKKLGGRGTLIITNAIIYFLIVGVECTYQCMFQNVLHISWLIHIHENFIADPF